MDQPDEQDARPTEPISGSAPESAPGSASGPTPGPTDRPGAEPASPAGSGHLADNPARYGAPLPPPSQLRPGGYVWPNPLGPATSAAPHPPRRRGPRMAAAAATALAVLAVAGGAGFALGRIDQHSSSTAGGPLGGYSGQTPRGETPFGGTDPFGGSPFGGPGLGNGSPFASGSSGTPATSNQLTGLVRISSTLKYENGKAAGTGMILTSTGEVITNHHVVQGSTKLRVTVMSTGRSYAATVVGTDAKDDVAVLQLQNASGLQTVTTNSGGVSVGDAVTAVGDAGGATARFTAAAGKVVATNQHITTSDQEGRSSESLSGLIEINSHVIPGDSGGATYDAQGHVVGMTTAASTGGRQVVGYAIPIAKVVQIARDLENGAQNARYDYGSPAFLGVGLGGSTTRVGIVYPQTPAARAGIVAGDAITRVGSTRVSTAAELRKAIRAFSPGDRVRLTWTDRSGTSHIASVTLMAGPVA